SSRRFSKKTGFGRTNSAEGFCPAYSEVVIGTGGDRRTAATGICRSLASRVAARRLRGVSASFVQTDSVQTLFSIRRTSGIIQHLSGPEGSESVIGKAFLHPSQFFQGTAGCLHRCSVG